MFEGKNIHYSTGVDRKALCSFSAKVCRQRRLNGYGFCLRHILEDPSAPFKQCIHTAKNHQQCLNPLPQSSQNQYCHSHSNHGALQKESPAKRVMTFKTLPKMEENSPVKQNGLSPDCRMSIQNRLKSKFGRLCENQETVDGDSGEACGNKSTDGIEDPYAFHDVDPPKPASGAIPPQITTSPGGVLTLQFPIMPSLHSAGSCHSTSTTTPKGHDRPTGTVPIAKLYPELAEKLERVRNKTDIKPAKPAGLKNASSQRTMHRLQTKIAQNKIKDKLRKSLSNCTSPEQQPSTPLSLTQCECSNSPPSCDNKLFSKETTSPSYSTGSVEIKKTSTWGRKHSNSTVKNNGGGKSPNGSSCGNLPSSLITNLDSPGQFGLVTVATTAAEAANSKTISSMSSISHILQTPPLTSSQPFAFIQSSSPITMTTNSLSGGQSPRMAAVNSYDMLQTTQSVALSHTKLPSKDGDTLKTTLKRDVDGLKTTVDTDCSISPLSLPSPLQNPKEKKSSPKLKRPVISEAQGSTDVTLNTSQLNSTCVRLKQPRSILVEAEARKRLKRHSAVRTYAYHASQKVNNADLVPMGIDSSDESDVDDELPWQRHWMLSSSEEDEDDQDEELDEQLASNIRRTKLLLHKSKLRRQFTQLRHMELGNSEQRKRESGELKAVLASARASSQACVTALMEALRTSRPGTTAPSVNVKMRESGQCSYSANDKLAVCDHRSLPYTNYCQHHILYSTDQQVFEYCTAKFADHTQCSVPVFDCRHKMPLCPEHAAKADNYGKNHEPKPKKPRKKTKPSALTRPPKKGKKKKNQRKNSRPQKPASPLISTPHPLTSSPPASPQKPSSPADVPPSESDPVSDTPSNSHTVASDSSRQPSATSNNQNTDEGLGTPSHDSALDNMDSDFGDDLEQSFSPGTIEKNLGLPLDTDQATNFLDEHDLNDVLNKLPDEAFDLLAGTADRNGFVEEAEALAQAFADVSHNFTKESIDKLSQDTGISLTPDHNMTLTSSGAAMTSQRAHLGNGFGIGGGEGHGDDDLTKQIADSLLREDPLSPNGSISDDLGQDNLNDLASSLSATDLKNISQVLSSCTVLNSGLVGSQPLTSNKAQMELTSQPHVFVQGQGNLTSADSAVLSSQLTAHVLMNSQSQSISTSQGQTLLTTQGQTVLTSHGPSVLTSPGQTVLTCQGQSLFTTHGPSIMNSQVPSIMSSQTISNSRGHKAGSSRPVATLSTTFPVFHSGLDHQQGVTPVQLQAAQSQASHFTSGMLGSHMTSVPPTPQSAGISSSGGADTALHPLTAFSLLHTDQSGLMGQTVSLQTHPLPVTKPPPATSTSMPHLVLDAKSGIGGIPAGITNTNGLQPHCLPTANLSMSPSGFKLAYPLQTLIPTPTAMLSSNLAPGHSTLTLANATPCLPQASMYNLSTSLGAPKSSSSHTTKTGHR